MLTTTMLGKDQKYPNNNKNLHFCPPIRSICYLGKISMLKFKELKKFTKINLKKCSFKRKAISTKFIHCREYYICARNKILTLFSPPLLITS